MNSASTSRALLLALTTTALSAASSAQDDLKQRVERLEAENAELHRMFGALAEQQEDLEFGSLVPPIGEGQRGLGPAASKVYAADGLSIGGYGEAVFQDYAGGKTSQADLLRTVFYFGYRFDDRWLFNSEIEFEHASTGKKGEASVEFAYVDYAANEHTNVRAGLLLVPMGFLNELHEPSTFLGATRPETETRLIPSTWREVGVGVAGDAGPWAYRVYAVNGFDGAGFDDGGLRGGRQKGSKAKADDVALVARADWVDTPGVLAGASIYHGDSGQGAAALGDTTTTIAEVHGEYRSGPLWVRGLYAQATVDDVPQLNTLGGFGATESVGEELQGAYLELGYDLLQQLAPDGGATLSPYLRYEMVDTQAEVPSGFVPSGTSDFDVVTVGLNFQPIDQVVIKLDYQDYEFSEDRVNLYLGYSF